MTKPSRPVNYTLQGLSAWALLKAAHINPASRSRKKEENQDIPPGEPLDEISGIFLA